MNRIEKFNHLSKHLKEMRELFMQISGRRIFWAKGKASTKVLKGMYLEYRGW